MRERSASFGGRAIVFSILVVSSLGVIGVGGFAGTVATQEEATEINTCTEINTPGNYVLGSDLEPESPDQWENSDACLRINSSDVVLDGNGHSINGSTVSSENDSTSVAFARGIQVHDESTVDHDDPAAWLSNVTVRNVTLAYWGSSVHLRGAEDVVTENFEVRHPDGSENLNYRYGSNVHVRGLTATEDIYPGNRFFSIRDIDGATVEDSLIEPDERIDVYVLGVVRSPNAHVRNITINGSDAGSGYGDREAGIDVVDSTGVAVTNNTLAELGEGADGDHSYGIRFAKNGDNSNGYVADNDMRNVDRGMELYYFDDGVVEDNRLEDTFRIYVRESSNASVVDNPRIEGITLSKTSETLVEGNHVEENSLRAENADPEAIRDNGVIGSSEGIIVDNTDREVSGVPILNNTINGTGAASGFGSDGAIGVFGTDHSTIRNNAITEIGDVGITLVDGTDHIVTNNTVTRMESSSSFSDSGNPILVEGVRNTTVSALNVLDNTEIDDENNVVDSTGVTITDSRYVGNNHGFVISGSTNVSIGDTVVADNDGFDGQITVADGSKNVTGSNVSIGASTQPDTTVSFEARDVDIDDVDDPPGNPQATSAGRYVAAESRTQTAYFDLSIHYASSDVDGVDESTLALWKHDTEWTELGASTADTEARTVSANITGFSTFGVFARESDDPAAYAASTPETNAPVVNGSTLTATAEVENTGDLAGAKEVTLSVRGSSGILAENRTNVSLDAGESTNVTVAVSTGSLGAGNYTVVLDTGDASAGTGVEVTDTMSIERAVAGADGTINLSEIQAAINWWAEDEDVPNTGGETISLERIQSLINAWAKDEAVA